MNNKFTIALTLSVIVHIIILFFILANHNPELEKQEEPKYVKVKIGQVHQKSTTRQHQKSSQPAKPKQIIKKTHKPKSVAKPKIKPKPKPIQAKKKPSPSKKPSLIKPPKIEKIITPEPITPTPEIIPTPNIPKVTGQQESLKKLKTAAKGSKIGNRRNAKEVVDGYKQLIVLWLEQNQIYPEQAKKKQLTGLAKMRLKIRKDGKLLSYKLVERTGFKILDTAIIAMIENSDPFPPFPPDYHDVQVDEFEIKANIVLKKKISAAALKKMF